MHFGTLLGAMEMLEQYWYRRLQAKQLKYQYLLYPLQNDVELLTIYASNVDRVCANMNLRVNTACAACVDGCAHVLDALAARARNTHALAELRTEQCNKQLQSCIDVLDGIMAHLHMWSIALRRIGTGDGCLLLYEPSVECPAVPYAISMSYPLPELLRMCVLVRKDIVGVMPRLTLNGGLLKTHYSLTFTPRYANFSPMHWVEPGNICVRGDSLVQYAVKRARGTTFEVQFEIELACTEAHLVVSVFDDTQKLPVLVTRMPK